MLNRFHISQLKKLIKISDIKFHWIDAKKKMHFFHIFWMNFVSKYAKFSVRFYSPLRYLFAIPQNFSIYLFWEFVYAQTIVENTNKKNIDTMVSMVTIGYLLE